MKKITGFFKRGKQARADGVRIASRRDCKQASELRTMRRFCDESRQVVTCGGVACSAAGWVTFRGILAIPMPQPGTGLPSRKNFPCPRLTVFAATGQCCTQYRSNRGAKDDKIVRKDVPLLVRIPGPHWPGPALQMRMTDPSRIHGFRLLKERRMAIEALHLSY